ncbi:hypothetical protein HELRODRAFT_188324 [Helobdella robusta]|uniref:G-protein coupled receptors family 1 profile domain-containing protein n=1 Tax=Helobdella robusta TaxID=6412 RepID=T1FPV7_HELRO|nr:hypothetical protein HELRODRAFT_188324 [Helobdella robusta]ESO06312.1 hypothetical protein HELRODRAFT_188324 [Helobdella robusta]
MCLSLNRYIAIKHPVRSKTLCRTSNVIITIASVWAANLLIMIPLAVYREHVKLEDMKHILGLDIYYCLENWGEANRRPYFDLFLFVLIILAPVSVVLYSYFSTGHSLLMRDISLRDQANSSNSQKRIMAGRRRLAFMLMIIGLFFFVSWMPFAIYNLYLDFMPRNSTTDYPSNVSYVMLAIGHSHSAQNPVLYCIMNSPFKHQICRMFSCRRSSSSQSQMMGEFSTRQMEEMAGNNHSMTSANNNSNFTNNDFNRSFRKSRKLNSPGYPSFMNHYHSRSTSFRANHLQQTQRSSSSRTTESLTLSAEKNASPVENNLKTNKIKRVNGGNTSFTIFSALATTVVTMKPGIKALPNSFLPILSELSTTFNENNEKNNNFNGQNYFYDDDEQNFNVANHVMANYQSNITSSLLFFPSLNHPLSQSAINMVEMNQAANLSPALAASTDDVLSEQISLPQSPRPERAGKIAIDRPTKHLELHPTNFLKCEKKQMSLSISTPQIKLFQLKDQLFFKTKSSTTSSLSTSSLSSLLSSPPAPSSLPNTIITTKKVVVNSKTLDILEYSLKKHELAEMINNKDILKVKMPQHMATWFQLYYTRNVSTYVDA